MAGIDNHFALMGEGLGIIKALDESSVSFLSDLNRLREIIIELGGDAGSSMAGFNPLSGINATDLKATEKAISDYLEELSNGHELNGLPAYFAPFEARALAEIAKELRLSNGLKNRIDFLTVNPDDEKNYRQKMLDFYASSGVDVSDIDTAAIAGKYESTKNDMWAAARESAMQNPELKKLEEEYKALANLVDDAALKYANLRDSEETLKSVDGETELQARQRAIKALRTTIKFNIYSDERYEQIFNQFNLAKELSVKHGEKLKKFKKRYDEITGIKYFEKNRVTEQFWADGEKILSKLMSITDVTEEQATSWAESQEVEKKAVDRLKKIGYPVEQVRKDMAEFYRICGGRLPKVRIVNTGDSRASTSNTQGKLHDKNIYMDGDFSKKTLWHEMGHHLENDMGCRQSANAFLERRRTSDKVVKLKKLVPQAKYKSWEVAYPDKFITPYIGKYYSDGSTEVFSVGMEMLSNAGQAALFAARDMDMFNLITGYLATKNMLPSTLAGLQIHSETTDKRNDDRMKSIKLISDVIDNYAKGVVITLDGKFDDPKYTNKKELIFWGLDNDENAQYLGSFGKVMVFKGKFKNKKTGRNAVGHKLVITQNEVVGHYGSREIRDTSISVHSGNLKGLVGLADKAAREPTVRMLGYNDDSWYGIMSEAVALDGEPSRSSRTFFENLAQEDGLS